jgi:hypothetical protein
MTYATPKERYEATFNDLVQRLRGKMLDRVANEAYEYGIETYISGRIQEISHVTRDDIANLKTCIEQASSWDVLLTATDPEDALSVSSGGTEDGCTVYFDYPSTQGDARLEVVLDTIGLEGFDDDDERRGRIVYRLVTPEFYFTFYMEYYNNTGDAKERFTPLAYEVR